jgi:simple sugar transport system permease protein
MASQPITQQKKPTKLSLPGLELLKTFLFNNMVTILFVVLCYAGFKISGLSLPFVLNDLIQRVTRNLFLVLSLIVPVLAGMGLNFGIVLGAMAGQTAIIMITHWGMGGFSGFAAAAIVSTPIAIIFGVLTGKLLNKTKGQEMITSMITAFFASGLYQLLFLVLVGTLIPMQNEELLLSTGVGIKNTLDLANIKYAVDNLYKMSFPLLVTIGSIIYGLYVLIMNYTAKKRNRMHEYAINNTVTGGVFIAVALYSAIFMSNSPLNNVKVPMATVAFIVLLCLFNLFIVRTKLGQDFRTIGQDMHIAKIAGIAVDKTRVIAITISMVLAAWGQLFLLQNLGNLNTYGSHEQVGMFAIASILIGGASVQRATISHALLGSVLFHTLFIVSPFAGRKLFGDPQIGEFFRAFVAYGVIAVSLGMYAWKKYYQTMKKLVQ